MPHVDAKHSLRLLGEKCVRSFDINGVCHNCYCCSGVGSVHAGLQSKAQGSPAADQGTLPQSGSNKNAPHLGFKPITPDSPEPRLACSPKKSLQDPPQFAAKLNDQSLSGSVAARLQLTESESQQRRHQQTGALGTRLPVLATSSSPVQQMLSPVKQHNISPSTRIPARMPVRQQQVHGTTSSRPVQQMLSPVKQHNSSPSTRIPARMPVRQQQVHGSTSSRPVQQMLSPAKQHNTSPSSAVSVRMPVRQQQVYSKPTVAKAVRRKKALPGWDADFSIQYEDPVSIKDQERMHSASEAACALPPLPGCHNKSRSSPSHGTQQKRAASRAPATCQVKLFGGLWQSGWMSKGSDKSQGSVPLYQVTTLALPVLCISCSSYAVRAALQTCYATNPIPSTTPWCGLFSNVSAACLTCPASELLSLPNDMQLIASLSGYLITQMPQWWGALSCACTACPKPSI